jgi:hypothetical protein
LLAGLVVEKIKHSQTCKNRDFWKQRAKEKENEDESI